MNGHASFLEKLSYSTDGESGTVTGSVTDRCFYRRLRIEPFVTQSEEGVVAAQVISYELPPKSVGTDNTVGTADLTAQDIFDAITNSSDPIAKRLRNVSTVQITGDQISSI